MKEEVPPGGSSRSTSNPHEDDPDRTANSDDLVSPTKYSDDNDVQCRLPREQTKTACLRCKKRKGKCSGERPVCSYCQRRKIECRYDTRIGASKRAELERQLDEVTFQSIGLGAILHAMQFGSDEDSTMLLARLRLGETLGGLASSLSKVHDRPGTAVTAGSLEGEVAEFPDLRSGTTSNDDDALRTSPRNAVSSHSQQELSTTTMDIYSPQHHYRVPLFDKERWASDDLDTVRRQLLGVDGSVGTSQDFGEILTISGSSPKHETMASMQNHRAFLRGLYDGQIEVLPFITVHPNIKNSFGNLPVSSAVTANHFPEHIQSAQKDNLTVPAWAMKVVNGSWDGVYGQDPMTSFLLEQQTALERGVTPDTIFGAHPYVGALSNGQIYDRAPPLSQWSARMVNSIKEPDQGLTLTRCASMYHFWYVMRWMIYPTVATYEAIPAWLRPTPSQLFKPHPMLYDFMTWPGLRDIATKDPGLQSRSRWLLELARTITCHWDQAESELLCINPATSEIDLSLAAKENVDRDDRWSVGPTIRYYLKDADMHVRIRK